MSGYEHIVAAEGRWYPVDSESKIHGLWRRILDRGKFEFERFKRGEERQKGLWSGRFDNQRAAFSPHCGVLARIVALADAET